VVIKVLNFPFEFIEIPLIASTIGAGFPFELWELRVNIFMSTLQTEEQHYKDKDRD
jgi:hypothetical protein